MYLQKAGGIFKGLDDNAVFVGEYTHTGSSNYFTPSRHGDDKTRWVGGMGEYTHMGGSVEKAELIAKRMTDDQLRVAYNNAKGGDRAGFLKEINRRKAAAAGGGGGGGGSGGAGGILASLSPTKVLVGGLIIGGAVLGIAKLTGGRR